MGNKAAYLRGWLAEKFLDLALRLQGNNPHEWIIVIIHTDDTPGMWVRESHAERDIAAYREMVEA